MARRLADVLTSRGYATCVIRSHVRAAAIFSGWLERQRIAATDIDEPLVARFVNGLPRRRAPERRNGRASELAAGVHLLAAYLWAQGVAACGGPVSAASETDSGCSTSTTTWCTCTGWSPAPGASIGATRQPSLPSALERRRLTGPDSPCRRLQRLCRPARGRLSPSACRAPVTATRAFSSVPRHPCVVPTGIVGAAAGARVEARHVASRPVGQRRAAGAGRGR